jgi:hypothetical protein
VIDNSPRKARELLAVCLSAPEKASGRLAAQSMTAIITTDTFLSTASSEAILPTLYPCLFSLNRLQLLPPDLSPATLQAVTQLNAERNESILCQLQSVASLLNTNGIQPLVLKGAAYLLTNVYPDRLGSRYLADIDLAIPESQMPAAQAALLEAGYEPEAHDAMARFRHHHVPLRKPDGGVSFELHHSLALGKAARRLLTIPEMLDASTVLTWRDVQLRIPSPEHLVTHLILHSQIRHPYSERIWPPLRAMYDLLLLNSRFASAILWSSIDQRFHSARQRSTLYLHLLQVEQTLGMSRPLPVNLTPFEKLRWFRRRVLNRWPTVRFFDPAYLILATLSRRFRLLLSILDTPGGYKSALQMVLTPGFYRRLLDEIL